MLIASLVSINSRMADQAGESSWAAREATLRREVGRLEAHIHNLESEKAELAVSASEATKPLLRWGCSPHSNLSYILTVISHVMT